MTSKCILLLFCAFVAASNSKDLEPVHKFKPLKSEVWEALITEEKNILKALDEKFNENFESFDAEMKTELKSLEVENPKTVFEELAEKFHTDVVHKSFKKNETSDELDYEKIAMQAVKNYYRFYWNEYVFFLKKNQPEIQTLFLRRKNPEVQTSRQAQFFERMSKCLELNHRDFGPVSSLSYYKPPLMNRDEPLDLFNKLKSKITEKFTSLFKERFVNWAVHRYLKQNDSKRLIALSINLAEACVKKHGDFIEPNISIRDARAYAKADFEGKFLVLFGKSICTDVEFDNEFKAELETFIQGQGVKVKNIYLNSENISICLNK